MTHLWGDADLVFCPLSGCCRSVGLTAAYSWVSCVAVPMVSLPGWAFVVWGHSRLWSFDGALSIWSVLVLGGGGVNNLVIGSIFCAV